MTHIGCIGVDCPICPRLERPGWGTVRAYLTGQSPAAKKATRRPTSAKKKELSPEPCIHRGQETRRATCGTCTGRVSLKVFACAKHGECTIDKLADGERTQCCRLCSDYQAPPEMTPATAATIAGPSNLVIRFDEKNLFPKLKGKRFNSSLFRHGDGWALAFRDGWAGSQIHIATLTDDFKPRSLHTLDLQHSLAPYGREDPRLFSLGDGWALSFIGVFGRQRILHTNQLYAELGPDWTVRRVFAPDFAARQEWEKNWAFFQHDDGQLYAVYSIAPHKILRIDGSTAELVHETTWPANRWQGGLLRGGAAPVRVGDEFYHFFHGRTEKGKIKRYTTGLYTFEAAPPFRVRRFTPAPLLTPDPKSRPKDQWAEVVFTCGAVLHDGRWYLSSGIHDRWTEIVTIDAAEIERRLEAAV